MKQIFVINESPSDVFSTHLSGMESLAVIRVRFQDSVNLDNPSLILLVNQKLSAATSIKERYHDAKVAVVFGGTKDFQPVVTLVYAQNYYDDFNYGNWEEFEKILFEEQPRLTKPLLFKRNDYYREIYRPRLGSLNSFEAESSRWFTNFLNSAATLSASYLDWQTNWITEVNKMSFPLSSHPKKRTSQLTFSFINEHRGLPIFTVGDGVDLLDKNGNKFNFEHDEYPIHVSVIQTAPDGIVIKFSHPVGAFPLTRLHKIKLDNFVISQRIGRMTNSLNIFCNAFEGLSGQLMTELSPPALFLARAGNGHSIRQSIYYPSEIIFNSETRKILRDSSQMFALLDMLSSKPISEIIGPAGTGKTFVSAIAVDNFIARGCNVLLISHSNLGVDNLLLEVAKYVDNERLYRLGNDLEVMAESVRKFQHSMVGRLTQPNYLGDLPEKVSGSLAYRPGSVAACTIDGFLMLKDLRPEYYRPDVIFCDEASRGLFAELAPLFLAAKYKVVLIGDNRQLGNIPLSPPLIEHFQRESYSNLEIDWLNNGFFNSLITEKYLSSSMLKVNRRSLPKISELVNQVFYEGQLVPGRFNPYNEGQVIFLDTKEIEAALEKKEGTSWHNPLEVSLLAKRFIARALKHLEVGGSIEDLVVITPYMAQVKLLKKKLRNHLLFHPAFKDQINPKNIDDVLDKLVITVDAIQGGQRKIVFVSLVRSNDRQDIGFNKDIRRINVAMSRAQEELVIIGNSQTFTECDSEPIASAFLRILQLTKKYNKYFVLK